MRDDVSLIPTSEEHELSIAKEIFVRQYSQPNSLSQFFEGNFNISLNELNRLNEKLKEKFKLYGNAGYIVNVEVKHADKKMLEFDSWSSFYENNWDENSKTESITIKWNFNAIFPNSTLPTTQILALNITNEIKPEEILRLVFSEGIDSKKMDLSLYPVYASAIFTNRIFADELINIISDWVKTVNKPVSSLNSFLLKVKKKRQIIAYTVEYLIASLIVLSSVFFYFNSFELNPNIQIGTILAGELKSILIYTTFTFILLLLSIKIGRVFGMAIFASLSKYGKGHSFALTLRDKEELNKLKDKEKSVIIKLAMGFIGIVMSSFIGKIMDSIIEIIMR